MKKIVLFLAIAFLLATFSIGEFKQKDNQPVVLSSSIKKYSASASVSLSIGEYHFNLFGYSSPHSLITIEGMGIFDQTYANENGFFVFNNRFSPFSPREACLTTQDQLGRISAPVCLPPFPTNYNVTIGPVVMPPTISLNPAKDGDFFIGDEVILSGQTMPSSNVTLSMFSKKKNKLSFVKSAYAFNFQPVEIRSDEKGNFSVSLPSASAENYRLFTSSQYNDMSSAKSLTLAIKILPVWMIIIKFFIFIWGIIKSSLLELTIIAEMLVIIYYLYRRFFYTARTKAIVLRHKLAIMKIKEI